MASLLHKYIQYEHKGYLLSKKLYGMGCRNRLDLLNHIKSGNVPKLPLLSKMYILYNPKRKIPLQESLNVIKKLKKSIDKKNIIIPVGSIRREEKINTDIDLLLVVNRLKYIDLSNDGLTLIERGDDKSNANKSNANSNKSNANSNKSNANANASVNSNKSNANANASVNVNANANANANASVNKSNANASVNKSSVNKSNANANANAKYPRHQKYIFRTNGKNYLIDIFICVKKELPFMLFHYTGSKLYNIRTRFYAKKKGWLLNQYGIWQKGNKLKKIKKKIKTEKDLIRFLGISYKNPVDRIK